MAEIEVSEEEAASVFGDSVMSDTGEVGEVEIPVEESPFREASTAEEFAPEPISQKEEDLHTIARSVMGSTVPSMQITQPERVRTVIDINEQLKQIDASDPAQQLLRESLLELRDTTLKAYKEESDKQLRVKAQEVLTKQLPELVGDTWAFGTELGKDALVVAGAAKGASVGASAGTLLAAPFPPVALVTVPTGFLLGGLAGGAVSNAVLDPIQDMFSGVNEEGETFIGNLANGGLTAALTGLMAAPFKAASLIRQLPPEVRRSTGQAMTEILTGSVGRTVQKTRANEANLKDLSLRLLDDGYLAGIEAWRTAKRLPAKVRDSFDSLLIGADTDVAKYAKNVLNKADSGDASMLDVHKALMTVQSLQLHQTLKNKALDGKTVTVNFQALVDDLAKSSQVGAGLDDTIARELRKLEKAWNASDKSASTAQLFKLKTAINSKFGSDAKETAKSAANKAVSRALSEGIDSLLNTVNPALAAQLKNANATSAAYHEFAKSIKDVSATQLATSLSQKAFSLNKSGETFGASLFGAKIGSPIGGAVGAAIGVGQQLEEGGDLTSWESVGQIGLNAAIGIGGGGMLGGGIFGTSSAISQTLSARLLRAKTLSAARRTLQAGQRLPGMNPEGKLVRSVDALRADRAAYTSFITMLGQVAGEEVASSFESMSDDDQKRFVADVASVVPQMFEEPVVKGLNSLIDDVILDPAERILAVQRLREERKAGLLSPSDYQQQVSSINLNGKIVTPKAMVAAAEEVPKSKSKTISTGLSDQERKAEKTVPAEDPG